MGSGLRSPGDLRGARWWLVALVVVALIGATVAFGASRRGPRASDEGDVARPEQVTVDDFGLATGSLLWGKAPDVVERDVAAIAQLGAAWLRAAVRWDGVEPRSPDRQQWARADRLVDAAERHGLRLVVTITGTPRWARPAGDDRPSAFAARPSDYAGFVGRIVGRYRDRVAAWELGNEPNHTKSFATPDPSRYAEFLEAGFLAAKRADRGAFVLSGGIGGTRDTDGDIPGDEFVRALYDLGAQRWFDALSYHPYTYPLLPSQDRDGARGWSRMERVREVMVDNGDADTQIWVTEFGAPTDGPSHDRAVTEEEQQLILRDGYRLAARDDWLGPLFWFTYRDKGVDPSVQSDHFGLVRNDGTPKPAAGEFRALARAAKP